MNIKKNSKNNTYYFSISLGFDAVTGNRRQTMRSGFRTKKDAEKEYNLLRRKYFENKFNNVANEISFSELVDIFHAKRKDEVKRTTYQGEVKNVTCHILPYFKNAKLSKVERIDIVKFQEHLKQKDLANNSINKIMLTLKQIFDQALELNIISFNHCISVKSLKVERTKMQFWTLDEFKSYINYVKEHGTTMEYVFYTFAYMTGARLSELLALKWEDINFQTATWYLRTSLHLDKENGYYLDSTKTKSGERKITLNKSTLSLIKQLKENSKSDFVFISPLGEPFPQRTILLKRFYKYIEKSGVKKIRFHDLRHSHVALLIDMQEQDFIIKERMGHASITITYDVYGHLFPTRQHELANRLEKLL